MDVAALGVTRDALHDGSPLRAASGKPSAEKAHDTRINSARSPRQTESRLDPASLRLVAREVSGLKRAVSFEADLERRTISESATSRFLLTSMLVDLGRFVLHRRRSDVGQLELQLGVDFSIFPIVRPIAALQPIPPHSK
jgi:hypothetical protein